MLALFGIVTSQAQAKATEIECTMTKKTVDGRSFPVEESAAVEIYIFDEEKANIAQCNHLLGLQESEHHQQIYRGGMWQC